MGFSLKWKGIKQHCDTLGLDFICSLFSNLVGWLRRNRDGAIQNGLVKSPEFPDLEKIAQTETRDFVFRMSSYTR
jgi:N-acetylneuraminate synthase